MERCRIDNHTFTFEREGPRLSTGRKSPTIVLLHGFPLDARVWAGVSTLLAEEHEVIRPNLRGFGPLTDGRSFSIDELAGDVRALLHMLDTGPVVMVGLSMGGYVALSFAKQWMDELAGLGLINTRAQADAESAKAGRDVMAKLARRSGTAAVIKGMLPKMLAASAYEAEPELVEILGASCSTPLPRRSPTPALPCGIATTSATSSPRRETCRRWCCPAMTTRLSRATRCRTCGTSPRRRRT